MAKIQKCSKCWREYSTFICPYCTEETKAKEVVSKVVKETTKVNSEKPKLVSTNWIPAITISWLISYTASELNHKFWKNLNSIKSEKICIEYQWRYILHEDIINQFKQGLS